MPIEKRAEETSVLGAVVDVLDAGQRVLLDRIELLSIEFRAAGASALSSLVLVLCGLGLLLVGWVAASGLAVVLIGRIWSSAEGLAVVAGVNVMGGAVALLLARRRAKTAVPGRITKEHDAERASEGGVRA